MAKTVEQILSDVGKNRKVKHNYLHVGFTLDGDDAKTMRDALEKAGVTNIASYVRALVLADLRKRQSNKQS